MINENGLLNIFPTAEASGSIVSFENGADGIPMESLSVAIEPTQDLHGYSSPWPAGGGKNKFDPNSTGNMWVGSDMAISYPSSSKSVQFPSSAGQSWSASMSNVRTSTNLLIIVFFDGNNNVLSRNLVAVGKKTATATAPANTETVLCSLYTYSEAGDVQLEEGSTPTAFAPYSNICPISGRTGANVYRTGKNLLDPSLLQVFNSKKYIRTVSYATQGTVKVQGDTSYALSRKSAMADGKIYYYDAFGNPISDAIISATNPYYFTTPPNCATIGFYVAVDSSGSLNSPQDAEPQLELGSATAYEPYAGSTYSFDWTSPAGTVYHGTVDPVTGQLTVDSVKYATTWGNYLGSTTLNACVRRTFTAPDKSKYPNYAWTPVSNILQYSADFSGDYPHFYVNSSTSNNVIVTLPAGTSDDTSIEVVYELATPITYQLTPQEITTLLGLNNVWSNAGDISLVYHTPADTTPSSIDGLFINGEGLQADGWFLKWRKLAAPKPKTDYVSVWGRDGDIDLTESETDGQVFYENRELTMDMVYMGEDWTDAYSELLDMLHGKECAVQFSNDPYWYWAGRIIASLYEHKPHSLTMSGIMFPYKLSVAKVTRSATVSGAIESNGVEVVLPSSRMRVSPKVTVVAGTGESVTLKWGTKTQTLSAGTYYVRGLKVGSDDVTIKVWGTGTVTFEYRKGML
jgi:hypothetical protein